MIVFDLNCHNGHIFEGWFKNTDSFEEQNGLSQVICPICSSVQIVKGVQSPNIASGITRVNTGKIAEMQTANLALISKFRTEIEKNCDFVGDNFAETARKIHYGEAAPRNIYGGATIKQVESLQEEGIDVMAMPLLPRSDA